MKQSVIDTMRKLNDLDFEILQKIYLRRCLTFNQIHYLFCRDMDVSEYRRDILQFLIDLGVIEEVKFKLNNKAYFLTNIGVEIVKANFDLPNNILDPKRKVIKRGYYTARELKMLPRLINHQAHLNQFVIEFEERGLKYLKDNIIDKSIDIDDKGLKKIFNNKFKYFDEKFLSQYVNIRPDGLINFLDTHIFLEMDMSTESINQLIGKWDNYRKFLRTNEFKYGEQKIIVFFIIENSKNIKKRIDLVRYTLSQALLDKISKDFEIFVGSKNELLDLAFEKIIPSIMRCDKTINNSLYLLSKKHNFSIADGSKLDYLFENNKITYNNYIRKLVGNEYLEFFFDDFSYKPLSVLNKIFFHDRYNCYYKNKFNRNINYLVLGKTEEDIFDILILLDLLCIQNVYYTTFNRLKNLIFEEAIFQVDTTGNVYHFEKENLENRVYEKTLNIKSDKGNEF